MDQYKKGRKVFYQKKFSGEYKKKRISISIHKNKDGSNMEEYVYYLTSKIRSQKNGMKTTQVNDFVRTFVVRLRGMNNYNNFLNNYL